ncbi:MAG: hypothetical protein V4488_15325 [Pseudomonadota bacterium]
MKKPLPRFHSPSGFASLLLASCIALTPFSAAHAQSVPSPKPAADDSWSYNTIDLWSSKVLTEMRLKTIGIDDDYIRLFIESKADSGTGELMMPRGFETTARADLNSVMMFCGERQEKLLYKWPLEPGKKWNFQIRQEMQANNNQSNGEATVLTNNFEAEVKGWETVDTPAGKFKAIKTVYKNNWTLDHNAAAGLIVITSWYSPQVKREIQSISETFSPDGLPEARTRQQLVSYQVK